MRADPFQNVLLITLDQWRADALGCAGNPVLRTPHLDALARDGVLFARHFSQAVPCGPARASLLGGMYQHNHGVMRNGTPWDAGFTNVALEMRKAGYEPSLFGYTDTAADPRGRAIDDPALRTYEGVMPGFDAELLLPETPWRWIAHLRANGYPAGPDMAATYRPNDVGPDDPHTNAAAPFAAEHSLSAFLTDELLKYLSLRRERQWFVHAAYLRPHPPFVASPPYHAMYSPAAMPPPRRAATAQAQARTHPLVAAYLERERTGDFFAGADRLITQMPDEELAQLRATYFGMVTEVDAQLGRLFAQLEAWDLYDRTLIVVTADHGEMLGDHWMLGKDSPYEQAYRVPLIVRDPSAAADATRGRVDSRFTEAVDVMPTILQWAGLPVPRQCDGRSLIGVLRGDPPPDWRRHACYEFDFRDGWEPNAQSWLGLPMDASRCAALRDDRCLYVHFAALPPMLFDLHADPHCLRNVAAEPHALPLLSDAAQRLASWLVTSIPRTLTGMTTSPTGLLVRHA